METRLVVTITPGNTRTYAINVQEVDLWNDDVVSSRGGFRDSDQALLHEVLLAVERWQGGLERARASRVG